MRIPSYGRFVQSRDITSLNKKSKYLAYCMYNCFSTVFLQINFNKKKSDEGAATPESKSISNELALLS